MGASGTSDPRGARTHARAMAGTHVEAMPTVPATLARELPKGVTSESMLWEETIGGGGYAAKELARGARLRLMDLEGDACLSMLLFNAERPVERLNIADTVKVQWNAYLKPGSLLLSDMGRVLISLLEDNAETHDTFCGPSNERTQGGGANFSPRPNARERLILGAAKFGLGRKDVHPCVNWFKGARVGKDGKLSVQAGPFAPGRSLLLRVEMNVIVVLANCPHVLDRRESYVATPVRISAWRGPVTSLDDPVCSATPEGLRAFINVEEYFRR
jgi:urea carboxylase-associated protein 2